MRLREFDYDTAPKGTGRLATAHAFNYRSADSRAVPYEVQANSYQRQRHSLEQAGSHGTSRRHHSSFQ